MTTTEHLPGPATLPAPAQAELEAAVVVLEGVSLPIRLAAIVGSSVEAVKRRLPAPAQKALDAAVQRALVIGLKAAMRSRPEHNPTRLPQRWLHRGMLAASGASGGAFGLPGTVLELPVSTTLLLRQIAAIAAEQGEDLRDPAAQAECLKVFALGGWDAADDQAESGYFAMRLALAEPLKGMIGRSIGQVLPGFLSTIASRFGVPVAMKLSAQAAPVVGAATGAAVNLAFLEHFRSIATAHFTVRRLERQYGAALVRRAYEALALDVPFTPRPGPMPSGR